MKLPCFIPTSQSATYKLKTTLLSFLLTSAFLALPQSVNGTVSSCQIEVSPTQVSFSNTYNFNFHLTNTSAQDIVWIRVFRPSENFQIISCDNSFDWSADGTSATIYHPGISGGVSIDIPISVAVSDQGGTGTNWSVFVSDQPDDSDLTACTGSLSTTIEEAITPTTTPSPTSVPGQSSTPTPTTGSLPAATPTNTSSTSSTTNTPPAIAITPLALTYYQTSPRITAQITDDSQVSSVNYSTDNGTTWNSIPLSSTTSRSINLNFTPSVKTSGKVTVKMRARDNLGSFSSIEQIEFTLDNSGPKLSCPQDLTQPSVKSPIIICSATDPANVASLEFSMNNGFSWQNTGSNFSPKYSIQTAFTPPVTDDGTYSLLLRAIDNLGNPGISEEIVFTIDRIPPRFGSLAFLSGTYTLSTNIQHEVESVSGLDLTIQVSLVGGPVEAWMELSDSNLSRISLIPTQVPYLWIAKLTSPAPGSYPITITAKDGAGHVTTNSLITLKTIPPGRIHTDTSSDLTVYFKDPLTNSFSKWDGIGYGISNPQTAVDGQYHLILPAGTYYLTVSSPGYRTLYSHIFTLEKTTPITQDFYPLSQPTIKLGSFHLTLPILPPTEVDLVFNSSADLTFTSLEPETKLISSLPELKGQPTLLSILNTWSPQTPSQLASLSSLTPKLQKTRIVILVPHESSTQVQTFKNKGNYPFNFIADPDGEYLKDLEYHFSPTTYMLDNNGQPFFTYTDTNIPTQLYTKLEQ